MKTVLGATAGLRRDQLSVGTCLLEDQPATAVGSSGTVWAYNAASEPESVRINVREKEKAADASMLYQFESPLPENNVCYFALKEIIPSFESRSTTVTVRGRVGTAQLQFCYPRTVYTVWPALALRESAPLESVGNASEHFPVGGAATANLSPAETEIPALRWTEVALSAFPGMRGMTAMESAAYKSLKSRLFQRR